MRALAVVVLAVSLQLHTAPAAAARCGPAPTVVTRGGSVTVDATHAHQDGLVVVWRMYEPSAETFWARAGQLTVAPTLHHGRVRVWIRYGDSCAYSYRKRMH